MAISRRGIDAFLGQDPDCRKIPMQKHRVLIILLSKNLAILSSASPAEIFTFLGEGREGAFFSSGLHGNRSLRNRCIPRSGDGLPQNSYVKASSSDRSSLQELSHITFRFFCALFYDYLAR
ncbi:hypothetical protein CDAR_475381 [Caerostris darwini]|uniref:Uncharacterized protein n=1 Tax=Caerostris darwini TaxID=1538125 RepID=A0AAV4PFT2_9ARAC|nr:hypothetical protein CDAR_475381 [Caerostris darwini]